MELLTLGEYHRFGIMSSETLQFKIKLVLLVITPIIALVVGFFLGKLIFR